MESQLSSLESVDSSMVESEVPEMRARVAGQSRRERGPQSANLEQLYHQALPGLGKALSHSGPAGVAGSQGEGLERGLRDTQGASQHSMTPGTHSV